MIILNKPNIWGVIWDAAEMLHIGLPFGLDAYVFGKMMGYKGKRIK